MRQLFLGLAFVAMVAGIRTMWPRKTRSRRSEPTQGRRPCYDEIAMRAYFIGLERDARGEASDPLRDWVEAEQELFV